MILKVRRSKDLPRAGFTSRYAVFRLLLFVSWLLPAAAQIAKGRLDNWDIKEASGLAASRKIQGVLYTHNDSGDRNRIFAINEWGQHLATYIIENAQARDWEDIAIGPGPEENVDYLYIGDIGDNRAYYPTKIIYRVKEPNTPREPKRNKYETETIRGTEKIEVRFPGHAGNANSETLMVDPVSGDLFIIRKTSQHPIQVFKASAPLSNDSIIDLEEYYVTCIDYDAECQHLHYKSPAAGQLVGGDISPSGLGLLVKSYSAVYYWRRSSTNESFFQSDPRILPYMSERQGEAICWAADEKGYYTLSEGSSPMLYYYPYQPHHEWLEAVQHSGDGDDQGKALTETPHSAKNESNTQSDTVEEETQQLMQEDKASTNASSDVLSASATFNIIAKKEAKQYSWDMHLSANQQRQQHLQQVSGTLLGDRIITQNECTNLPDPSGMSCYDDLLLKRCKSPSMKEYQFCKQACGRCKKQTSWHFLKESQDDSLGTPTTTPEYQGSTENVRTFGSAPDIDAIPVDDWWEEWLNSNSRLLLGTDTGSSQEALGKETATCESKLMGRYSGPVVKREKVSNSHECCNLCSKANREGDRCDAWSYCEDGLGCGTFPYGTCLLKRSITYDFKTSKQWISGTYGRQNDPQTVLGVRQGPEEQINWAEFFKEHAHKMWMESMYLIPMNTSSPQSASNMNNEQGIVPALQSIANNERNWLCQPDQTNSGVLECPRKECHALRGKYKGLIVSEFTFPSAAQCCEACINAKKLKIPPHNLGCDLFSFCANKDGCGLMQPYGTCLLKVVSQDPQLGLAWSFNPLEPWTSGKVE